MAGEKDIQTEENKAVALHPVCSPIAGLIDRIIADNPQATNETIALLIAAQNASWGLPLPSTEELNLSVGRLEASRQAGRDLRALANDSDQATASARRC